MKYSRTATYLLPSPYKTNDLNYNKIGCKSTSDCIDKCNVEWSFRHCYSLPPHIIVDRNNNKHKFNESCYDLNFCQQKFKSPDCINEYYAIGQMIQKKFNDFISEMEYNQLLISSKKIAPKLQIQN